MERPSTIVFLFTILLLVNLTGLCAEDGVPNESLKVEPSKVELTNALARVQLVVGSQHADGRNVDATREAAFVSSSPEIVTVSSKGRITPHADGSCRVTVKSGNKSIDVPVVVSGIRTDHEVSFNEDVIPALTKAGCNQGACHGSQFGQGGFKLSLLGFAPEQDHPAIVRASSQRRVSLVSPADSLLLQKAVAAIPHGGGRRMLADSPEFAALKMWIQAGAPAPDSTESGLTDISVNPTEREYREDNGQQLRVIASYDDGSHRDVTHRARYDSLASGVATVTRDGYVTADGTGQTAIMIRYRGKAIVSSVVRPFADNIDLSGFEPRNFVDEHVKTRWQKLGLQPSKPCTDEQFIRRAFVAAIGTLPTTARVQEFLASDDPQKRSELINEILGLTGEPKRDIYVEEWSAYWTQKWGDLLRNNREKVGDIGMWAFANWVRSALRNNKPMDEFAREILLAQGSIYQNGQANFYKVSSKPTELAETTAQVFLGVRLQCAQCHQHPFESYSQADYYGLAAFFTRVTTKRSSDFGGFGNDTVVRLRNSGSIKHPRTGVVVPPTPLGDRPLESITTRDLRRPLAEWLTSPKNLMFARNIVNRTWGHLMGTALVEPIDDMRATNPASNPQLLDALAARFVDDGYDLRKLMHAILTSETFQLSSTATPENAADTRFYSHYPVKRLPAEVLLDAIDVACGTQERFIGVPLGTKAIELPDPNFSSYFLDTLGRPQRLVSCECERTAEPNLAQVLQLANGELVQRKLADKKGRIAKIVDRKVSDEEAFTELYLTALSRYPSKEELDRCSQILSSATDRRTGFEDILWALINTREFLFNH